MAFNDPVLIPYAHGKVGVSALCVLWAQPLNALLRPHPGVTRRRRAWEYAHALLGRAALVLGASSLVACMYVQLQHPFGALTSAICDVHRRHREHVHGHLHFGARAAPRSLQHMGASAFPNAAMRICLLRAPEAAGAFTSSA